MVRVVKVLIQADCVLNIIKNNIIQVAVLVLSYVGSRTTSVPFKASNLAKVQQIKQVCFASVFKSYVVLLQGQ